MSGGFGAELVRVAVAADRPQVEEIVRTAYQPWVDVVGGRPAPMDADYAALIARGEVHVTGSDPVAGVIVLVPEPDGLLVENVAVRLDRQGQGIGRRLLAYAEDLARRLGLPAVRLYTHERMASNLRLYESLGYAVTGRQPIDAGHLIHLRKAAPLGES